MESEQEPLMPESWPGAFGVFKYSSRAVQLNLVTIVTIFILDIIVFYVLNAIFKDQILTDIFTGLLSVILEVSTILAVIAGVRGQKMPVDKALSKAVPLWLKMLVLEIIVRLTYIVSLVLLIIPFFFVLPRLILASYFLVDKNMGIMEAYKASWEETRGHSTQIWGVIAVTVLFAVLCLILIGIPLYILYSAAFAVLYESINKSHAQSKKASSTK